MSDATSAVVATKSFSKAGRLTVTWWFIAQVKEALMTSALLKLPQTLSRARKEERVEQILEELVGMTAEELPAQHTDTAHRHLLDARHG